MLVQRLRNTNERFILTSYAPTETSNNVLYSVYLLLVVSLQKERSSDYLSFLILFISIIIR